MASSTPLTDAVEEATDRIAHRMQGPTGADALARLRKAGFGHELVSADTCAARFLELELDPQAEEPVGGEGRAALGAFLRLEGDDRDELGKSVAVALGMSYLTMLTIEGDNEHLDARTAPELWAWWIDHMRPTATLAYGLPGDFVASDRSEGRDFLLAEIKRLGLMPGALRRRGLSDRLWMIAGAGTLLRLGQTSAVPDGDIVTSQASGKTEIWPLH